MDLGDGVLRSEPNIRDLIAYASRTPLEQIVANHTLVYALVDMQSGDESYFERLEMILEAFQRTFNLNAQQ